KPACVSAGFHAHPHLLSLPRQITIKLLGALGMWQPLLLELTTIGVDKCYLLEARVIIASYNQHVGSFLRALVGLHHQSLPGGWSRHCHGINSTQNPLLGGILDQPLSLRPMFS